MLSASRAFERFEAIARRDGELAQRADPIELGQLSRDDVPERRRTGLSRAPTVDAVKEVLGGRVGKGTYHAVYYNTCRDNVP